MLAHAILAVIAARERARHDPTDGLIPLWLQQNPSLLAELITTTLRTIDYWLSWSHWRRCHQSRARPSHYHCRGHQLAST
jgi:hypothetical protein